MYLGLVRKTSNFPTPVDPERAQRGLDKWRETAAALPDSEKQCLLLEVAEDASGRALLEAVFGNSPFLTHAVERDTVFVASLLAEGPDAALAAVMSAVAETHAQAIAGRDPSAALRRAKRRIALTTAIADIAGLWELETVTRALTVFADAALDCAVSYLLGEAARKGVLSLPNRDAPAVGSGLIVLGMGKLGAYELNYSSDIDLIVFYDPERVETPFPDRLQTTFVRLTRGLVAIIDARTADGYVFRTDLRLRPDPASTPIALSVLAAETYYETLGQNWERAALIKARAVAGDLGAGNALIQRLAPYVWRRNLDFAAIHDIHSIKRQIYAHRGGAAIALDGHNIKLGRGGIREIEFFAQTQQLIWGGRIPALRASATVDALRALAEHGQIEAATAAVLTDAYRFLRRVEHRLQMIDDEQTHRLPEGRRGRAALATFLGYGDVDAFEVDLLRHLRAVETHYARLFEDAPALSMPDVVGGNLVFTGADPDPDTLQTLRGLGFTNPRAVDAAVRGWHHGRYRAMRSTRAREMLTELMPFLLQTLASAPDPDAVFLAFDRFLAGLPAGIQLFSLFQAQPRVFEVLVEIMGRAPRLAEHLARRPADLEGVLTADFFEPPPPPERLEEELRAALSQARDFEDVLDLGRRWANDRKFQVGVQVLRDSLDTPQAARAYSNIADAVLRVLPPIVETDFATRHGRIAGCEIAIVALGKLGGREMTATSDLDLIFVYATPADGAASDGPRPLMASQYFARLSQRLISAITALTPEGNLYDVDMRLRPSGKSGPIAVSFDAFERYQRSAAWTWERMALTRARVVAGPPALKTAIESVIREVLAEPRDAAALVTAVADMRARMDTEHHTDSIWEVKHVRGGLVDIEFITQYVQLRDAAEHPEILAANTGDALAAIRRARRLEPAVVDDLISALLLWQTVQSRVRLIWSGPIRACGADDAPNALRYALDGTLGLGFEDLAAHMRETADRVRGRFADLIERPAAAAADGQAQHGAASR